MGYLKKHGTTIAIAFAVAAVAGATPVIAHGVLHARFAHNAGKLDNIDSKGFVRNRGPILVSMSHERWQPSEFSPALSVKHHDSYQRVEFEKSSAGNASMIASPDLPSALYGRRLRLKGVEFCLDATDPGVTYNYLEIQVWKSTPDGDFTVINDSSFSDSLAPEENAKTCYQYPLEDPPLMGGPQGADGVVLLIGGNWSAPDAQFYIGATTLVFEPTTKKATSPL